MKKLLIVQLDDAYFLFETLQVLEKNQIAFKDYDVTVLVDEDAYNKASKTLSPLTRGLSINKASVLNQQYDVSVNLSLMEESWDFHGKIAADRKIGPKRIDGVLTVDNLWSTFLLTLKNKTPFLCFHLQQIYKNILGIRSTIIEQKVRSPILKIAYAPLNTSHFSATEQEVFINGLSDLYKGASICDISEIDLIDDVSNVLYLGPATFDSLRLCENGATGIFLSTNFQGFNLIPFSKNNFIISSQGNPFTAHDLLDFIRDIKSGHKSRSSRYSLYHIENDIFSGPYLNCDGKSDLFYPFYQAQVVLWNFLLNLTDVELTVSQCSQGQLNLLTDHLETVSKYIRLHEFALKSIDELYSMGKSGTLNLEQFQNKIKMVEEIDSLSRNLAASHPLLRQVLDFYQLRKSEGTVTSLLDEVQASYLIYAEEHQALQALKELFSVTLRKNEASI